MAKGGKLILMGDSSQIDTPYLDYRSNGLVYVRSRMSNLPNVAHIVLRKGERSPLAEMAAKLL
jgi:PhoH-like ATPase